jgi:AcrR family transcriptional regulator
MSQTRKTAQTREKDLRLAMLRIQRGRSHTGATRITIASIAREVRVSAALIHNHYPTIADAIRRHQGRDNRTQRDAKHQALKQERERARELRREIASLRTDVRRLSSINEVLLAESAALRSRLGDRKVVALKSPKMVPIAPPAGEPRGLTDAQFAQEAAFRDDTPIDSVWTRWSPPRKSADTNCRHI